MSGVRLGREPDVLVHLLGDPCVQTVQDALLPRIRRDRGPMPADSGRSLLPSEAESLQRTENVGHFIAIGRSETGADGEFEPCTNSAQIELHWQAND